MAVRHPRRDRLTLREQATSTRAIIAFHSHEGFDGIVNGFHPRIGQIVGVHTSKAFGAASGSFTITIKKPEDITFSMHRIWPDPEGTWVRIAWLVDGQIIDGMWGLIDTVTEDTTRSGGGARSETYTISGRDIGKIFEETKIFMNLFNTSTARSVVATQRGIPEQAVRGTPANFIRTLLELWIGNHAMAEKQWNLPRSLWAVGGPTFYDGLNKTTIQPMNAGNGETFDNSVLTPDQESGTALWDVMQRYNNGLMNEMWVDLAPPPEDIRRLSGLRPSFYLRERMFKTKESRRRWDALRTRVLEPGDIQGRQVAKGGAVNRFNYWLLKGGFLGSGYAQLSLVQDLGADSYLPGSIPIINNESIQKHSLRPYIVSSDFLPFNDPLAGRGFLTLAANWLKRLHDWYGVAHMQLSGTLHTTRVFPEIRIGEKVSERRSDGDVSYYVESVENSWTYPGAGASTLTVTHGEIEADEALLDILYRQYESLSIVTQDDCVELLPVETLKGANIEEEELIAQLAAGCGLQAPNVLLDQAQQESLDPGEFILNGTNITRTELEGAGSSGRGLVSEGAIPDDTALGLTPDPEMIPSLGDIEASHALAAATGATTETVPDVEAETQADDIALSQEALEEGRPIAVPPDDPFQGTDFSNVDPLAGIEEDLGSL
jgi:hypothetical protein